jgi:hypothetical protein
MTLDWAWCICWRRNVERGRRAGGGVAVLCVLSGECTCSCAHLQDRDALSATLLLSDSLVDFVDVRHCRGKHSSLDGGGEGN